MGVLNYEVRCRRGVKRAKDSSLGGFACKWSLHELAARDPRAQGHHFAAKVNGPQGCRSTPRRVERSGYRVSNRPTPGVFAWLRNEAAPVTILGQGAIAP
jgi:hypothetical protein